ncbi:AAA family ATPase [Candidatus Sumerlaeota bacterium]|nr:AAA family ATPase [Candidatus Sumerlaeota bacterium]
MNHNAEPEFSIVDLVDESHEEGAKIEVVNSALPVQYYKLETHPFLDNVNPDFFFRTEAHEEAYLKMKQCIEDHISIGLTTAISGTGKTLLTQILLNELQEQPERYLPVVALVYPSISPTALLKDIARELKLEGMPKRGRVDDLVSAIQEEIMRQHERGVKIVLIIDEVHFLKAEALHTLRTLSNIETPTRKLITILLFGEETFLNRMALPGYRALFSRMFVRTHLRPLHEKETEQYIKFRLLMAGAQSDLFDTDALDAAHNVTNGIPREINRLCHNALVLAAQAGQRYVTAQCILRAARGR